MSKAYLDSIKKEIQNWENQGPGYLAKFSSIILAPAEKAAEYLIPEAVKETVQTAVRGCLEGLSFGSSFTISHQEVLERLKSTNAELGTIELVKLSDDFKTLDAVAAHYWNWNLSYAVTQGMLTGATGFPGLAANIPALFTIIFRMLQQIALSYGYNPEEIQEKHFMINILSVASSADVKAKQAAMVGLKQVQVQLVKKTWKKLTEEKAMIAALKQFAKTIGIQLTKRKALQMVPIIGAVIGGSFDGVYCNDVGRAAVMSYRQRKIEELSL